MSDRRLAAWSLNAMRAFGALVFPFFFVSMAPRLCAAEHAFVLNAEEPCPAEIAQAMKSCILTFAPQETRDLRLKMPAGSVRLAIFEQTAGTIEVRLDGTLSRDLLPYTNSAGLHSRITILIEASRLLRIHNPSKDKTASLELTSELAHNADERSALVRAAEIDFAQAEVLRSQFGPGHADPIPFYDRAIEGWKKLGDDSQLARALIWKSDFLINSRGDAVQAFTALEPAAGLVAGLEPIEAAHYWQVSAFISVVKGDYAAALNAYSSALALCEKAGDIAYQAKILDNRARIEFMQGSAEKAMASEKHAAELAARAGDTRRQAFIEEMLGSIESGLGDFEDSYQDYGQALKLMRQLPPNPRAEATVWTDLSDFYITLGDLARARDALDQAMAIWDKDNFPVGLVDTLNNYADLYIVEDEPVTALTYFNRGLALSEKVGYERGSIALMDGIGQSYLAQKDAGRAQEVLLRVLPRAQKAGQEDSRIHIECNLGEVAQLQHDLKHAREYYENCRAGSVAAHDAYTEIRAEGSLANVDFEAGALEDAEAHCELALGAIEAIRGQLRNQDLRTSFLASQHAYHDLEIQILMRLNQEHPGESYDWRAFLTAERARARSLLDEVTNPGHDLGGDVDLRAVASQALLSQYEDVRRRLRRLETLTSSNGARESNATRAAIERLTISEQQLHQEIVRADEIGESSASLPALTLESLQSTLPNRHDVLVEYWVGEKASYAWSITRTGIRSFRLPSSATLDRECAAFRKTLLSIAVRDTKLSAQQRASAQVVRVKRWKQQGLRLASTLFPAGALPPSASNLLVIGDGPINSIPLASLPGLSVIARANGGLRKISIVNEPSAAILSFLESRALSRHAMHLAVFVSTPAPANPTDKSRQPGNPDAAASPKGDDAPLPFAVDEASAIRGIFGTGAVRTFPAETISPRMLQNLNWNEFSIGHFAMHARLNEKYAELTGLSVGDHSSRSDLGSGTDRLLWYGDIRHLRAHLDLVVLSGCDTALGERVAGEGLRGLTQAFFAAGSQRVVGTLWEVDDQATSEWMRHFYQALKETHSPAKALQRAQQVMAADPQWNDPYYWAGFVLAGDWRPIA